MIVIARSYGQLGNRLFLYAHMIAAAREYDTAVANPCFAEYAHLFCNTEHDLWCRYPGCCQVQHAIAAKPEMAGKICLPCSQGTQCCWAEQIPDEYCSPAG